MNETSGDGASGRPRRAIPPQHGVLAIPPVAPGRRSGKGGGGTDEGSRGTPEGAISEASPARRRKAVRV